MNGSQSPAGVLSHIPGWERASWTAMHGGKTNRTWLVEQGGRKGVLKIDAAIRGTPFRGRRFEARVQRAAAAAGLAPGVLFASETVYLTEYVEGRAWNRESLHAKQNLVSLAQALRRVHALPVTGRQFDAAAAGAAYMQRIGDDDRAAAARHIQTLQAAGQPVTLCCCHNDLVAENIIDTLRVDPSGSEPKLMLVDWEYACDNDPMFDLATVIAHHGLSESQSDTLLDAYFDGDRGDAGERVREQIGVYESLCWLWQRARP